MFYHSSDVCVIARTSSGLTALRSVSAVGSHLSPIEIVGVSPLNPGRFERSY